MTVFKREGVPSFPLLHQGNGFAFEYHPLTHLRPVSGSTDFIASVLFHRNLPQSPFINASMAERSEEESAILEGEDAAIRYR